RAAEGRREDRQDQRNAGVGRQAEGGAAARRDLRVRSARHRPLARRVRRAPAADRRRAVAGGGGMVIGRALVLALAALALAPAVASAHATLEGTVPARGAELKAAPQQVTFRFDESVE